MDVDAYSGIIDKFISHEVTSYKIVYNKNKIVMSKNK